MTLTAYDRRQLRYALAALERSRVQAQLALDGNDPQVRAAFAGMYAAAATRVLDQADRRITRRARQGS